MQSKASMYISPARMMVVSPHLSADIHQHAVIQFTCSLEGRSFSVWTEGDGWQQAEAVLINSGVAHSVKDFGGWQATICIIPDIWQGCRVQQKILKGNGIKYFQANEIGPLTEALQITRQKTLDDGPAFHSIINFIFNYLLQENIPDPPLDDRIIRSLQYIKQNIQNNISAAALAAAVHLSQDRFLHLFKQQTGAPLRQYVLWQRLAAAIQIFVAGKSIKEAAYEAGFSDPAHFSRSFQQMFGALPSSYTALKSMYHFAFFDDL